MNLLLDTHSFIWFINGDKALPKKIISKIIDIENKYFLSIASLWEIALKISLGKLSIEGGFDKISDFLINNEIEILPISFQHLQVMMKLKFHYRDPFDRLIISQGICEDFHIITDDKNFNEYTVNIFWK